MFFSSSVLTVWVPLAVSIIAIIVTIVLDARGKRQKRLYYEVLSISPIEGNPHDNLKVTFKGKDVTMAKIVVLRIWNAGNIAIAKEDFSSSLSLDFGADTEILSAVPFKTYPDKKLVVPIGVKSDEIFVHPFIWNKDSVIYLSVLLKDHSYQDGVSVNVEGTIADIDKVRESKMIRASSTNFWLLITFIVYLTAFCISVGDTITRVYLNLVFIHSDLEAALYLIALSCVQLLAFLASVLYLYVNRHKKDILSGQMDEGPFQTKPAFPRKTI